MSRVSSCLINLKWYFLKRLAVGYRKSWEDCYFSYLSKAKVTATILEGCTRLGCFANVVRSAKFSVPPSGRLNALYRSLLAYISALDSHSAQALKHRPKLTKPA